MNIYIYICMYMYIYTHFWITLLYIRNIYVCVYIYIYVCVCVCVCVCSYFYLFPSSVLDDCTLLRICLFILGWSFYWCIVAFTLLSISFCRSVFFLFSFVLSSRDLMTNFTVLFGFLLRVWVCVSQLSWGLDTAVYV